MFNLNVNKDDLMNLLILMASAVIIPWCVWVTVSIFKSKTELALMRQELEVNKRILSALERLESKMEAMA